MCTPWRDNVYAATPLQYALYHSYTKLRLFSLIHFFANTDDVSPIKMYMCHL